MRTFEWLARFALLVVLTLGLQGQAAAREVSFASPQAALEHGIGAYRASQYRLALPALSFAANHGLFFAQYYLARIYADNASPYTDHPKAYQLFRRIVDENANADPDDDQHAPYVGKALTAVAGYTRRGLPEIGLVANPERAAKFYREAATFFRDADAQFELAKMHLKGEGVPEDRQMAFHWLATLTQEGHAGAQAFLADILWRGKDLPKDEKRALALITVAVANAPEADRIWIEEIYQSIFCGSSSGTRQQADGLVAVWKRLYSSRLTTDRSERFGLSLDARSCGNGESIPSPDRTDRGQDIKTEAGKVREPSAMQGGAASSPGLGLREIGATKR